MCSRPTSYNLGLAPYTIPSIKFLIHFQGISVIAPRDEKGLKRFVDPSVLEFRQRMLFDPRKNRRESAAAVIRRREKMQSAGKDFARPLR